MDTSTALILENGRLLASIVIAEARRIRAIDEEGMDSAAFDAIHRDEMTALRIKSFRLPRIEFQTGGEFKKFVKDTANNGGVFFNDPRNYERLRDVASSFLEDFGCF